MYISLDLNWNYSWCNTLTNEKSTKDLGWYFNRWAKPSKHQAQTALGTSTIKAKNDLPPGKYIARSSVNIYPVISNPQFRRGFPILHLGTTARAKGSLDGKTPLWSLIRRHASPFLAWTVTFLWSLTLTQMITWILQATMALIAATTI